MSHVIFADGLAGNPESTFAQLETALYQKGYDTHVLDMEGIKRHLDRAYKINERIEKLLKRGVTPKEIFLCGFSAGGSATNLEDGYLYKHILRGEPLGGKILLSTAMPWMGPMGWRHFLTSTLAKAMLRHLLDLIPGKEIHLKEDEYEELIGPVDPKLKEIAMDVRTPIPSTEALQLFFCPPVLEATETPILLMYGTEDRWISPRAQEKLISQMRINSVHLDVIPIDGAGHHLLFSKQRQGVIERIVNWIGQRELSRN